MRSLESFESIYIYSEFVDFRKSINGLSSIVVNNMKLNIKSESLFVFTNRRRSHIKVLYFDKSGFALWLKRLESSKFSWVKDVDNMPVKITSSDLKLLLEGLNIWTRFKKLDFDYIS